jgi:integrase
MSTVSEVIRQNKPNISPSTLRSYASMVNSLQKKLAIDKPLLPDVIEEHVEKIKESLKNKLPKYRKTVLSALVSVLLAKPDSKVLKSFREQLLSDSQVYENEVKEQKLSDSQEDGYINWDTILEVRTKIDEIVKPLLKQKEPLDKKAKKIVQQWALLNLYTNQEPRRALEIATLKRKAGSDKKKDNYLDSKGNAVYNTFKTQKYLGSQTIPLHKDTLYAIKQWLRVRGSDSEYIFLDSDGKPLNSTKLGNLIKDIFDPINLTINVLRHSWVKHTLGDINLEKIQDIAHRLGQVRPMQTLEYIKKDTEDIESKNSKKIKSIGKGK